MITKSQGLRYKPSSDQGGCLPLAIAMVAALSVENPIVMDRADAATEAGDEEEDGEGEGGGERSGGGEGAEEEEEKAGGGKDGGKDGGNDERKAKGGKKQRGAKGGEGGGKRKICMREMWKHPNGDVLSILKAFGAYSYSDKSDSWAINHGLQPKLMAVSNLISNEAIMYCAWGHEDYYADGPYKRGGVLMSEVPLYSTPPTPPWAGNGRTCLTALGNCQNVFPGPVVAAGGPWRAAAASDTQAGIHPTPQTLNPQT